MGILNNIKNIFTTSPKERKEGPVVYYSALGYNVPPKARYDQLATEGYQENVIVYRCVNEIANSASRVKINLFRGAQEVQEHPLLDLLYSPSPTLSQAEFFQAAYAYLLISGNSYILSVGAENQPPTELYNLRPDRIRIRPSKRAMPLMYDYIIGGQMVDSYEVDQATGNSRIKHIKLFNPQDDYYGLSPIQAASVDIDQHNLASKHNVNLLQNGARPSGAVIFKPKDETGAQVQLSDVQRNQLVNDINQRFAGTGNVGKPMLLEGDFDWKEMGLSPKDMDFLQLKHMSAKDIALVYGVPSQLIGIPDSQTYSNFAEAKLALYNETIIPLLDRVSADFNEWLTPLFGEDLELRYDIDSIPAMAEQRRRVFESVTTGVRDGILTRNEAREQLGYEKIEGADSLLVPANLMPLNLASSEEPILRDETIEEEIPKPNGEDTQPPVIQTEEEAQQEALQKDAKGVLPFHDFPLASKDRAWDGSGARKRLQAYAGGENWNKAKYSRGFFVREDKGDNLGDYKLPFADVINGELKAIPRGLFAVAGAIAGARSEMNISSADKSRVQSYLRRYYKKMSKAFGEEITPPFDKAFNNSEHKVEIAHGTHSH